MNFKDPLNAPCFVEKQPTSNENAKNTVAKFTNPFTHSVITQPSVSVKFQKIHDKSWPIAFDIILDNDWI